MRRSALVVVAALAAATAPEWGSAAEHPASPPTAGLVLWLDAADSATLTLVDGTVTAWRDKSPRTRSYRAEGRGTARHVADGAEGHAMVRFDGNATFASEFTDADRTAKGTVTVFTVSRRVPDQVGGPKWQRIVSSWNGSGRDDAPPNFSVTADRDGNAGPYDLVIDHARRSDVTLAKLRIGGSAEFDGHYLRADLAEVLIYDREFLMFEDWLAVYRYLAAKWAIPLPPANGWTRQAPLGDTPPRVTDALPLSDQANAMGWVRHEPLSDEFAGDALNRDKWVDTMFWWQGQQPAWFSRDNVAVRDGMLHLTFRRASPPPELEAKGYRDFSSACAMSRQGNVLRYGYIEIRARPMASAASSSFWLHVPPGAERAADSGSAGREIDVFEIGGKAAGYERSFNMNLHAVRNAGGTKERWTSGGTWKAPFDLAADFHVYGLRWEADEIEYFVDGVPVRGVVNDCWHLPMYVIFDSESMISWFGTPNDADLPSTYSIDYVRTWVRTPP